MIHFFEKGIIGNFSGIIECESSPAYKHLCVILLIIKNITMKNSQIKKENCPNCWGHQEYACIETAPTENRIYNDEAPNFIRRFVEQHLSVA